jgi:hypothetical protein
MSTEIHSNKTGTVTATLNGIAKDPVWSTNDGGATVNVTGQEPGPSDAFTAIVTPVSQSGSTVIRLTCQKLDDSGAIVGEVGVQVVEQAATRVDAIVLVEN